MKKSKLLKSLGFASLAVFMGAAGVLAFAPLNNTPIMSSGLNAQASTEGQNFDLGLRPDTDPVVYVTESGLQIKKSNGKHTSTTITTTNTGATYTQDITSFYYFTMGTFSGTIHTGKTTTDTFTVTNEPVNWLIIGRGEFDFYDETPAGNSIENDTNKQEFAVMNNLYLPLAMQSIPEGPDNEIPDNCFLVLSEKLLGMIAFNSTNMNIRGVSNERYSTCYIMDTDGCWGSRYRYSSSTDTTLTTSWNTTNNTGGDLYNYINSLMCVSSPTNKSIIGDNKLGFTQAQANMIVPQQLYTYYHSGSSHLQETPSTDGGTYYTMFPLAYRAAYSSTFQNFCIEDYLTTNTQRIATQIGTTLNHFWWLRSGTPSVSYRVPVVQCAGTIALDHTGDIDFVHAVRPAMVIRVIGG